jgi:hypothetical protein
LKDQSQYAELIAQAESELKSKGLPLPQNTGDQIAYAAELSLAVKAALNKEVINQAREQNRADDIDRTQADISRMRGVVNPAPTQPKVLVNRTKQVLLAKFGVETMAEYHALSPAERAARVTAFNKRQKV